MQTIPVDQSGLDTVFLAVVPKNDLEGEQTKTRDGLPKWEIQALVTSEEQRRPEILLVTIAQDRAPDLAPMTPCQFENLVARAWSQGDRSGVAFSATQVRPSGKPNKPPVPSSNGNKPEPANAG